MTGMRMMRVLKPNARTGIMVMVIVGKPAEPGHWYNGLIRVWKPLICMK